MSQMREDVPAHFEFIPVNMLVTSHVSKSIDRSSKSDK